jgi:glutathione S-transferase
MLEEIGEPYELVRIDLRDEASRSDPEFLAASPMGKVPALVNGEVAVADSAAICMYLADLYPDAGLAPSIDNPNRASYYFWMIFTPGVLEPAFAEKAGNWTPTPAHHGWGDFPSMIRTVEGGLEDREWLVGDGFTAADLMVGSALNFLKVLDALPASTVLEKYIERCTARPAFVTSSTAT